MSLTVTWTPLGWCCFFLRRERLVCGGPPQFSNCWLGIRSERSVCWLFGSRSWQPTGGRPEGIRWREFRTGGCASFGIGPMSFLAHWPRLRSGSLLRHSQPVVFRRDFTGMRQFFIRAVRVGRMHLLLRFGTAQLCELFRNWRRRSRTSPESACLNFPLGRQRKARSRCYTDRMEEKVIPILRVQDASMRSATPTQTGCESGCLKPRPITDDEYRAPPQNYQFTVPAICSLTFTLTMVGPPMLKASPQSLS